MPPNLIIIIYLFILSKKKSLINIYCLFCISKIVFGFNDFDKKEKNEIQILYCYFLSTVKKKKQKEGNYLI